MGSYLNPGNEKFYRAINSEIYVDKTGLIGYTNKVLNTMQQNLCVSRPRRFGKSMAADMLTAYYSKGCDSRQMFSKLKISEKDSYEENLNKYDVIHFDVQWCMMDAGSPENTVPYISLYHLQINFRIT